MNVTMVYSKCEKPVAICTIKPICNAETMLQLCYSIYSEDRASNAFLQTPLLAALANKSLMRILMLKDLEPYSKYCTNRPGYFFTTSGINSENGRESPAQ